MTLSHYQTQFDQLLNRDDTHDVIHQIRKKAFSRFIEIGFPTQKWEDWRFTDLSHLEKQSYQISDGLEDPFTTTDRSAYKMEGVETIVIHNGHYQKALSSHHDGIRVSTNPKYISERSDYIKTTIDDPFDLLNTAFMDSCLFLIIDRNINLTVPVRILVISSGIDPIMVSPRIYVDMNESSSATLIEHYLSDATSTFQNSSLFFSIAENSHLDHIRIQSNPVSAHHVANLNVSLYRHGQYNFFQLSQGSELGRANIRVNLKEEGSRCTLNGLSLSDGNQHLDNNILVDHFAPNCKSSQNFKSILEENSSGVFNGKVTIRKDAQKTDAEQTNKNLLLSKKAVMNSNPQMEIYADDVRCSHGSSTGELDKDALFYLRSRGLDYNTARSLMIRGFTTELLGSIKHQGIQNYLTEALETWIRKKSKK